MRETGFPDDPAAADSVALEVTVAMAVGSSKGVAKASQDMVLAMPSLNRSASPSAPLATNDVVQQFDATHRLSELIAAWGDFATFATSFGEKL